MAKYVLAIDQGTTSSRALLFDKDGQVASMEQAEFGQHYPKPGWVEHDPLEILSSVLTVCQGAMAKVSATKADIVGIGITNQRETTVAWDKETGEPLCKAVVWLDLRTADISARLSKGSGGKDRFRKATGLPISTYFSAVKMAWMMEEVPEVKAAADAGRLALGTVESWLIYKLTGGKDGGVHVTDVSNASRYMLMNIKTLAWDASVCKAVGIPMGALPDIKSNAEVYGQVKGVEELDGLPITAALGDQHAALLGQGCLKPGSSKNTYGTGCFLLLNTGKDPVPSASGLLTTVGYKLGPDASMTYALEGSVACAGRTVQWLRDNLGMIQTASEIETYARQVEDTGGVTVVPAFTGLFAPYWRDDARAVAVGMSLYTRREHICRAVLEAVAFSTVDVIQAMKKDTGLRLDAMRVDGGMTANDLMMQIQADLLGVDVVRAKMPEATALGVALAAGLASGFYSAPEDVEAFLEKAGGHERFRPALAPPARSKARARWNDAVNRAFGLNKWSSETNGGNKSAPLKKPAFQKVSTIKPEQRNLNLLLKVAKLPETVIGEELHDVVCGDDTGVVTLRLRPAQFLPAEANGYLKVQNAKVIMIKGFINVMVDKWGKVTEHSGDEDFEVNTSVDVSSVEYELK